MLGDINLAEPEALIAFAGPRVVKETIKKELPPGFQTSEFLLEHGFLDFIIDRAELKERLGDLLYLFEPATKSA
jgi:acetyl-CoA carboxylase carboxyl transferase subunit beta